MLVIMIVMQGIVCFAAWIPAQSNAVVLVFAGLLGFSMAAVPPLVREQEDFTSSAGVVDTQVSVLCTWRVFC